MTRQTWTLTDVDQDVYLDQIALTPANVRGTASGYSVVKRTLRGGLREGVDVIEVDNGVFPLRRRSHAGHGHLEGHAWQCPLGWNSPVKGPVHPSLVDLWEPSGIGWLDGFDELLVRCGLESNGAPEFNANGTLRYPLARQDRQPAGPQCGRIDRRRSGPDRRRPAWSTNRGCSARNSA